MSRYILIAVLFSVSSVWGSPVEGERTVLVREKPADPRLGLGDGFDQRFEYPEPDFPQSRREERLMPVLLASADLDRDGVPDLLAGYRSGRHGLVAFHPGHIDAIFPPGHSPDARPRPFRDPAVVLDLPSPPEWLGVGDFDADGRPDLLAGAADQASLYVLLGDGRGGFPESRTVALEGPATALAIGPFGRVNGLPDVVVGIMGPSGPEVRVYGTPKGLFRGEPERRSLSAEASSLVLAELTGDHLTDLAIVSGRDLLVMHGREVLPWVREGPAPYASPLVIDQWNSPSAIVSLAAARSRTGRMNLVMFDERGVLHVLERQPGGAGTGRWHAVREVPVLPGPIASPVALVPLRTSSLEGDDVLVADQQGRRLHFLSLDTLEKLAVFDVEGLPAAVLPMRLNEDGQSDLVLLVEGRASPVIAQTSPRATFTVDSAAESHDTAPGDGVCADGSGVCTLRAAIEEANAHAGSDAIGFSVRSSTIAVTLGALPMVTDPVTIVGSAPGIPRIELDGSDAGTSAAGLTLGPGSSSSVVRSLVFNRFSGVGVRIESADNRIEDCFIGPDRDGLDTVPGNGGSGVLVTGEAATGNTVGGASPAQRNLISNNGTYGVEIGSGASGNTVAGNYVGTDSSGSSFAVPNSSIGVRIRSGANGNIIGGAAASPGQPPGNVISGNGSAGVFVESNGNAMHGNVIGGGSALGNALRGVGITGSNNTIGGASVALRNVVSGNLEAGVTIGGDLNVVQGNFIGLDVTGTAQLGNAASGVRLGGGVSALNTIGGVTDVPGAPPGNVISANLLHGVELFSPSVANNVVAGNLIGTDWSGTLPLANGGDGILVSRSDANTIGGAIPEARNVIAGSDSGGTESTGTGNGVEISEARGTIVIGNYIGTDVTGTGGLGFPGDGVLIVDVPNIVGPIENDRIGGSAPAERNVISGNLGNGVRLSGPSVTATSISGNFIGLDATGSGNLLNLGNGVLITGGAHDNRIGGETGTTPGACTGDCNAIAWNSEAGVRVDVAGSVNNAIRGNSIYRNGGLGIDLEPLGPTPNDPLDTDSGPNDRQNFPSVTSVAFDGTSTTVSGVLASAPDTTFVVDVFGNVETDPSGHGEGRTYLGSTTVMTDGAGAGLFTIVAPGGHGLVSATATGLSGSTSEFGMVRASPGEVRDLLVSKGVGGVLVVTYSAACGATNHVAYVGSGGPGPLHGPLAWSAAYCGLGMSGSVSFDPGSPGPGTFLYFVLVGQDAEQEGSYGRDSAGAERPEAVGLGSCDRPRAVVAGCP